MREKLLAATLAIVFLSACVIGAGLIVLAQSGLTMHAGLDIQCGETEYDPFDNSPEAIASRLME